MQLSRMQHRHMVLMQLVLFITLSTTAASVCIYFFWCSWAACIYYDGCPEMKMAVSKATLKRSFELPLAHVRVFQKKRQHRGQGKGGPCKGGEGSVSSKGVNKQRSPS
jgi:hypothetical protein